MKAHYVEKSYTKQPHTPSKPANTIILAQTGKDENIIINIIVEVWHTATVTTVRTYIRHFSEGSVYAKYRHIGMHGVGNAFQDTLKMLGIKVDKNLDGQGIPEVVDAIRAVMVLLGHEKFTVTQL
jgi:hypothetical protein